MFWNKFQFKIWIIDFSCSVKQKLHEMLQTDKDFNSEDEDRLNPCRQISIANALKFIKNPKKCCEQIYDIIQQLRQVVNNRIKYVTIFNSKF